MGESFQENFNHAILECLNPMGEILPGQTTNVEWKFSPLEAKTYMVCVVYVNCKVKLIRINLDHTQKVG